jgi:hypothetical protein
MNASGVSRFAQMDHSIGSSGSIGKSGESGYSRNKSEEGGREDSAQGPNKEEDGISWEKIDSSKAAAPSVGIMVKDGSE